MEMLKKSITTPDKTPRRMFPAAKVLQDACWACLVALLFSPATVFANPTIAEIDGATRIVTQREITGRIVDEQGNPIEAVTVSVKETAATGMTDSGGNYRIAVPAGGAVLVFTATGFVPQEVSIGASNVIDVVLEHSTEDLDEVVVVGFGTQKKVSIVGAVSTIAMEEVRRTPTPSISQALVGRVPGLVSRQTSGEPGKDQAYLYIRGLSNWNDNTPIVIVDGIERDLNTINIAEVESITFLKDATATAVYGIRGANGVIIITTKKGEIGAPVITLRSEVAQLTGMRFPDFINSGEFAELWNEARLNDGLSPTYRSEEILRFYDGSDPYLYPNVNWIDEVLEKSTMQTLHNLNISGGNERVRYFVNLGYTMQDGLFKTDPQFEYGTNVRMHRYNLRSNVDVTLSSNLVAEIGLGLISRQDQGPGYGSAAILNSVFDYAPHKIPMYNPDGTFGATIFNNYTNPYMQATHGGYTNLLSNNMQGTFTLKWDLGKLVTEGLSWTNTFSFDQNVWGSNQRLKGITSKEYEGIYSYGEDKYHVWFEKAPEIYSTAAGNTRYLRFFSQANYNRSFGAHGVSSMLMFNLGEGVNLLAADGTNALPSRVMGISGRAVYDFNQRYIAEFSFGYNGSENFAPGRRYGFFPGVALGWNIANESFWKIGQINMLKIRGSAGKVGNDRTGGARFAYLSTTGSADGYLFGESFSSRVGYAEGRIGSEKAITWEEATKYNLGLDVGLFRDKLTFQVDAFKEMRDGLLVQRTASTPQVSGFGSHQLPWANIGKTENKGIEGMLQARNTTAGGLFYSVKGNITFTRSLTVFRDEPINKPDYQAFRGHSLSTSLALVALGFFEDQEDILNSPVQTFGPVRPGDIKYRDVNGDGMVDQRDEVMVGHPQVPELMYGFGFTLAYKGFDVSAYFTGAGNASYFSYGPTVYPFVWGNDANVQREFYEHRWRPGADNTNARYPAVSSGPNLNNNRISTLYMRNSSYFRLKNAEIGYAIPERTLTRLKLTNLRFFVNGIDLLLWDNLGIVDPEMNNGNSAQYPKQRTINTGVEIIF